MSQPTPPTPFDAIQREFEKFHADNPHVLAELERMTREWFAQGQDAVGIGMLWEAMRWRIGVQTRGDLYRLNNNYRSRYARLLIARHPDWNGRIRTRELSAAA